jgi:hypothetical protein
MDYLDRMPFKFRKKKDVGGDLDSADEVDMEDFDFTVPETEKRDQEFLESEKRIKSLKDVNTKKARISIIKEKMIRAIKKNVTSFRSCVLKRKKVTQYTDSIDLIELGCGVLTDICAIGKEPTNLNTSDSPTRRPTRPMPWGDSPENRALLFTDDGWYHLESLYRKHPMRAL